MTPRGSYDNATVALGLVSLASLFSLLLAGDLRFAVITGPAIGVAVVLGVLAVIAGATSQPWLAAVAGAAFVVAAIVQVVLVSVREPWLGGNASASAVWLGLGVGLLVLSRARRPTTLRTLEPVAHPEETA